MNDKISTLILILLFGWLCFSCSHDTYYPDALNPEEALASFQLHEGFTIELFASEPQVMDPVSMVFDENGNIYVVEMPDYPSNLKKGRQKVASNCS